MSKHQIQGGELLNRLMQDETAEPVWRDQILWLEYVGKNNLPFSADHERDWQHYPIDPSSCFK